MASSTFILRLRALWLWLFLAPAVLGTPTVYFCGDSTMAPGSGRIVGWARYAHLWFSAPVVNKAVGGCSARSFTVEGRFKEVAELVKPGDFVVIEFGHNDGGSLREGDNGRTACPGAGSETCSSVFKGKNVTIKTFPAYMTEAGKMMVAKGAKVVFSSPTPNNICETGSCSYTPSRFTTYAKQSAKAVGEAASFVDHGLYVAKMYKRSGAAKVNSFYPHDHTHTNSAGAHYVARAFMSAIIAAKNPLTRLLKTDRD